MTCSGESNIEYQTVFNSDYESLLNTLKKLKHTEKRHLEAKYLGK